MGFGEAVKTCFSKYATFSGRARRSEFWFYYLFVIIINAILGILLSIGAAAGGSSGGLGGFGTFVLIVMMIWSLAIILPTISVQVRRLHDTDRSGGWWWIGLIPFVGIIILIVFWVGEGTRAPNRFGPDPKA